MQPSPDLNIVEKARPWLLGSDILFFLERWWTNVEGKKRNNKLFFLTYLYFRGKKTVLKISN